MEVLKIGIVEPGAPGSCQRPGPHAAADCSAPSASLLGKVWKSHQQTSWPRPCWSTGGHQRRLSEQMAPAPRGRYLMRREGGRARPKWHFPVERGLADDVTPARSEARENSGRTGLRLSAARPASQPASQPRPGEPSLLSKKVSHEI